MDNKVDELEKENKSLKGQLLQVQKAYLIQQRELNILQMEKVDDEIKALAE